MAVAAVDADNVAVADFGDRAGSGGFRRDVDGGWDFAGSAGKPAISDQRDFVAAVLQNAQGGHQAVEFGHAVGLGALEADDDDGVLVQLIGFEGGVDLLLVVEDAGWGFDDVALRCHGGGFL